MTIRLILLCLALSAAPLSAAQTIKIATLAPDGSLWMRSLREAGERIEKGSEGRVKFKFYPGGVMGNDATVLRKMRLGQLQGGMLTGSELELVYKDAQIYSLPFLFRDDAEVDAVRAKVDPLLIEGFARNGLQVLAINGIGFAYLMSAKADVDTHALAGSRTWVPQNDSIALRTLKVAGVSPIPLPVADVFTSLQSGLVDTVSNTPVGAVALQWHGSIKSVVDLPLAYVVGYVVLDKRAFERIAPVDRPLVLDAFRAISAQIDRGSRADDAAALDAMRGQGIAVRVPPAADVAHWRQVGVAVAEQLAQEGAFTPQILQTIEATLAARRSAAQ